MHCIVTWGLSEICLILGCENTGENTKAELKLKYCYALHSCIWTGLGGWQANCFGGQGCKLLRMLK